MRDYVGTDEAKAASGLRVTIVRGTPSPWGEAVKGMLHIKGLDWVPVNFDGQDVDLVAWTGEASAPVAIYENEAPKSGAVEIMQLIERLAPEPVLVPGGADVAQMAEDLLGKGGLAWSRRLQQVHVGLSDGGGFSAGVSGYLAAKYGYEAEVAQGYGARVVELLTQFEAQLAASDGPYLLGAKICAADIQLACTMALFAPLPQEICAMHPKARAAFGTMDAETRAAVAPRLLAHRDHMYARHLETPLTL
ncbi:hypothetical protein shim_30980 [Shimia sp. SK013]|uniref:glutathione S-transferase family protein n=1 Tax=Shimia sp. SK013 TaxID=1389006 RepID=UPI0006B449B5|nr:glutathione S-transferase family protein [Shimia sp. SK013]KPA20645.1 hypothetical protein shim_30980 [Shimia sp. SK013]